MGTESREPLVSTQTSSGLDATKNREMSWTRLVPRVLVTIVFHSDTDALSVCIDSVVAEELNTKIVVWDTSDSGKARQVAETTGVMWRDGSRNAGYAWAIHAAVEEFLGEFDVIVASNSDVRFLDRALGHLVAHSVALRGVCYGIQKTAEGVVAPYSIHPQLSLRDAVARWTGFGRKRLSKTVNTVMSQAVQMRAPVEIPHGFAGSGAVIVMPRHIWLVTGGFDRDFFLFEEDRSFATTLQRGEIPAYLCGDCEIEHDGGFRTRGRSIAGVFEFVISEQIAWKKHSIGPLFFLLLLQLIGLSIRCVGAAARGRWDYFRLYRTVLAAFFRSMLHGSSNLYGTDGLRVPATAHVNLVRRTP